MISYLTYKRLFNDILYIISDAVVVYSNKFLYLQFDNLMKYLVIFFSFPEFRIVSLISHLSYPLLYLSLKHIT